MLSCRKAIELVDKRSTTSLTIKETIMLRMHANMCGVCGAYQRQSKILDDILYRYVLSFDDSKTPQTTNNELQRRIVEQLNQL